MRWHGNQKRGLHVDWFGALGASKQVAGVFVQIRMYIRAQLYCKRYKRALLVTLDVISSFILIALCKYC